MIVSVPTKLAIPQLAVNVNQFTLVAKSSTVEAIYLLLFTQVNVGMYTCQNYISRLHP